MSAISSQVAAVWENEVDLPKPTTSYFFAFSFPARCQPILLLSVHLKPLSCLLYFFKSHTDCSPFLSGSRIRHLLRESYLRPLRVCSHITLRVPRDHRAFHIQPVCSGGSIAARVIIPIMCTALCLNKCMCI